MIDSEVTSTVAAAGGQYAQAKHTIGPLMAFNVGLYLVLAYTMLEAADVQVAGQLVQIGVARIAPDAGDAVLASTHFWWAFTILTLVSLAFLNYRGVFMTLTVNFIITAAAFASIIILFFGTTFATALGHADAQLLHHDLLTPLPYGWIGVIAALHFGIWFYLGIEGTCQAAEEVRSPGRALPLGTMTGIITLLIAAALTWYVACGLLPWEYVGWDLELAPLYDAAKIINWPTMELILFVGTLFSAIASANGCINDAARAWFSMGRDRYLPAWFAAVHPKYRTPFRSILFLIPIAAVFASEGTAGADHHLLDPVGPAELHLHADQHLEVPQDVAPGHHPPRLRASDRGRGRSRTCRAADRTSISLLIQRGRQICS